MYIPSKFLHEILSSEQSGVFCESNSHGDKVIVAKLPASTIKAIFLGAKLEFYVITTSNQPHYLALCMKIFDNDSSPMHAILAQRWQDSNNLFNSSFIDSELDFILYDETDAPVQEGKIKFKTNFKNKRVRNILNNYEFTSANHFVKTNNFIDSACADLGFDYERGLDIQ